MPPSHESRPDFWEIVDLAGGVGIVALPLFLLAVPAVVLLLPLAVVGLALAVLAAPPLAVIWAIGALRRRSHSRRAPMSRSGEVPRQAVMHTMKERPA